MAIPGMMPPGQTLDGPPPSPQAGGAGPTGEPTPQSLQQLAPPVPSNQVPPEILTGILQSAETIGTLLDSYSQALPDLAVDFQMIKSQLQQVFARLMTAGAGPTSPTASGPQFPAAMDRGIAGPGAV